jgi:hypothetical protein
MSQVEGTCAIGQTSCNVTNPNTIPIDVGLISELLWNLTKLVLV